MSINMGDNEPPPQQQPSNHSWGRATDLNAPEPERLIRVFEGIPWANVSLTDPDELVWVEIPQEKSGPAWDEVVKLRDDNARLRSEVHMLTSGTRQIEDNRILQDGLAAQSQAYQTLMEYNGHLATQLTEARRYTQWLERQVEITQTPNSKAGHPNE